MINTLLLRNSYSDCRGPFKSASRLYIYIYTHIYISGVLAMGQMHGPDSRVAPSVQKLAAGRCFL